MGGDPVEMIAAQIRGGADLIQLREKNMPKRGALELGLAIRNLTTQEGIPFIVNDDLDLAMILEADGVHLGQDDIPIKYARPLLKDKIIGISTHSLSQAREAIRGGADYIGLESNIGLLVNRGIKRAAVISDIFSSKDIEAKTRALKEKLRGA